MIKKTATLAAMILCLASTNSHSTAPTSLIQAEKLCQAARADGQIWLGVGKLLLEAKKASKKEATKLIEQASRKCQLSIDQARREKEIWRARVPR